MYQKRDNILSLFCSDFRKKFYLREISKESGLLPMTVSRILEMLEKENIIRHRVEGKHKYFELNLDNIKTKFLLVMAEIYKTFSFLERYPVFKSFLKEITKIDGTIVVYGSFANFTATEESDLDVLTISDKKTDLPRHLLPYRIHEINMAKEEFFSALKKGEPLIKEIFTNHIILHNHSFFVDAMWWYYEQKT